MTPTCLAYNTVECLNAYVVKHDAGKHLGKKRVNQKYV